MLSFFYCDFRKPGAQNAVSVIGSLVAQLCSQMGFCPEELDHAFSHSKNGNSPQKRPSFTILREVLRSLARLRRITLLIDAIDECEGRKDLLDFLISLRDCGARISVLVSSREEMDIKDALKSFMHVRLESHTKDVDEDIKSYIEHRLVSDQRLQSLQSSLKEDIKQSLRAKSAGM